jgi:hypothetical protein
MYDMNNTLESCPIKHITHKKLNVTNGISNCIHNKLQNGIYRKTNNEMNK